MDCQADNGLPELQRLVQFHRCVVGIQIFRRWPIGTIGRQPLNGYVPDEGMEEPKINFIIALVAENRLSEADAVNASAPVIAQTNNAIVKRPMAQLAEAEAV